MGGGGEGRRLGAEEASTAVTLAEMRELWTGTTAGGALRQEQAQFHLWGGPVVHTYLVPCREPAETLSQTLQLSETNTHSFPFIPLPGEF